jgi:hypothetical protein
MLTHALNEKAEDPLRQVEKEEERLAYADADKQCFYADVC